MNKLFSTIAIVALASLALSSAASAKPGNGNNGQIGGMGGGAQINVGGMGGGGGGGAAGGGYSGGSIDSPGDAFYPDLGYVGDPRQDCLEAGGRPVRQHGADIEWGCVL